VREIDDAHTLQRAVAFTLRHASSANSRSSD
jgi:hypothetical protein